MIKTALRESAIFSGDLILVDRAHPMRGSTKTDLIAVNDSEVKLQRDTAIELERLMRKICGWSEIAPVSGFRSFAEQQGIWNDCLKENGTDFTRKYVAIPGHSEHQTGLAIDLGKRQKHIDFVRPEFPDNGICGKFKSAAAQYGFILRYPKGKEFITGIAHEPWHFRYVGAPHAEIMLENGFVLEEYIEFLKRFAYPEKPLIYQNSERAFKIFYLSGGARSLELDEPFRVSGNNIDGYIITKWGE